MGRLLAALIAVLVALAACGVRPASEPAPSVTATSGRTEAPASPASPGIGPGSRATRAAAESVLIGAKYGNGKDAQTIIDKTDELQGGFTGTIKAGDEAVATVGFAVPFSELKKVTFIVDPNDDLHEAISFSGPVQRD